MFSLITGFNFLLERFILPVSAVKLSLMGKTGVGKFFLIWSRQKVYTVSSSCSEKPQKEIKSPFSQPYIYLSDSAFIGPHNFFFFPIQGVERKPGPRLDFIICKDIAISSNLNLGFLGCKMWILVIVLLLSQANNEVHRDIRWANTF